MAGWNEVKIVPVLPDFDSLGRNAYPRNVNEMQSYLRFRLLSPAAADDLGFGQDAAEADILQILFQPALSTHAGLATLSHTVHHRIIGEPLKLDRRETRVIQRRVQTRKRMKRLASTGDTAHPCGVPRSRSAIVPSGNRIGAFNQRFTYNTTHFWSVLASTALTITS